MIAETSAVSAVFRTYFDLVASRSRWPGAECDDVPTVDLPPPVLLHKVPGTLVVLDLSGKRGLGLARDGRRVARDLGVRPLYEHHALHLVESAVKGGLIREPFLSPTLGGKLVRCKVISPGGSRIERLHRLLRRLGRKLALFRDVLRWGGHRLPRTGRGRRALLLPPALVSTRVISAGRSGVPATLRAILPGITGPGVLNSTIAE